MKNRYIIYGLIFESEIELNEFIPLMESSDEAIDVVIKLGKVPSHLPKYIEKGVAYQACEDDFIFIVPHICRYRVQKGKLITCEPLKESVIYELKLFLFGSVFGALFYQRDYLPIHGSSFMSGNGGIIISGHSGSGKSSLTAEFELRGNQIISDDITLLTLSEQDEFVIMPGVPYLKIWKDVIDNLDIKGDFKPVRPNLKKYYKPLNYPPTEDNYSISKIIVLSAKNVNHYRLKEITGFDKLATLRQVTYRYKFVEGLNKTKSFFRNISNLSTKYELYLLERPKSPLQVKGLADFIETHSFI